MKFNLFATLMVWALLAVLAVAGSMSVHAAAILFVISGAALAPYRQSTQSTLCACPSYFEGLRIATESLGDEIYSYPSPATPYFNYITRGTFLKHSGVEQTTFTGGRVEPISKSAGWSAVSLANNIVTGGACVDAFTKIPVGFDENTFSPRKLQLQGPELCRDTFTYAHMASKFIQGHYVPRLSQYVKSKIDLEFRDQTMKFSNKMSIAADGFNDVFTGTTNPTIQPTSQLTWSWLNGVAARLIGEGASNPDGTEIELGASGPVFPAFIGIEALDAIFNNVPATLVNYQFADMGKGAMANTLRALGASRSSRNFRFAPVTHPPRADFVGGILVEREAFVNTAATHGTKSIPNTAYENADFEAVVIPHPRQWEAAVVSPDNAGLDFDPANWSGEWKFVTGGERIVDGNICFDPLHKWGSHFSEYVYAPEPVHPLLGWVLWFLRCPNDQSVASCGSGT